MTELATILVRLPYGRLEYGEALNAAERFARRGYAVVVEDLRGTHDSQGEFEPYAHGQDDGAATLDWIVAQPWSNGRVGAFGCSALGETQYVLARAHHPALRAMIPLGAGGAIGSAAGRHSYFGLYEGGVFELASGFGWFVQYGAKRPQAAPMPDFDIAAALRELPVADLVQRHRPGPNGYDDFVRRPLADPAWHALGYLDDTDLPAVPTFEITTWGDQTVGDTLAWHAALARKLAARAWPAPERHLVIAPGTHCHGEETGRERRASASSRCATPSSPYFDWYARWFDRWLRDRGDGLAGLPPVLYYMLGEQRWHAAASWPPPQARVRALVPRWRRACERRARRRRAAPGRRPASRPTMVRLRPGSPGALARRAGVLHGQSRPTAPGPADQRAVEARDDVLVYTSPVLAAPLRIAGPLRAVLTVSSSAPDTDFVARLVDVAPDGRALGIQEGALRARYREGFAHPEAARARASPWTLAVDMRAIACDAARRPPPAARHRRQQLPAPGAQPAHGRRRRARHAGRERAQPRASRRREALLDRAAGAAARGVRARAACLRARRMASAGTD